ncbi:hypothetical protein TNCV_1273301 [Trichonephila clavipes]|nr:hypothetical protein TNCV_1273301 [Trichonephila clavipes]
MRRVNAKFVLKLMSVEQKELRLAVAQDLWYSINAESGFLTILENENAIERILFQSKDEITQKATVNTIPKKHSSKYFQQWKEYLAKCVKAQVAYFEGG